MSRSGVPRQPLDRSFEDASGGADPLTDTLCRRGTILVGGFGNGKTEIAIALARRLSRAGCAPYLLDLDIVTPYFRPRDIASQLAAEGVRLVAPQGDVARTPLPAVAGASADILKRAAQGEATAVVDPGGDAPGVGVVRSLVTPAEGASLLVPYVYNGSRDSDTPSQASATRRAIEGASGLRVSHLISNTHIGRGTTLSDVLRGVAMARKVAEDWGLPLLAVGTLKALAADVSREVPDLPVIAVPPCLGLPWESFSGAPRLNGAGDA